MVVQAEVCDLARARLAREEGRAIPPKTVGGGCERAGVHGAQGAESAERRTKPWDYTQLKT